MPTEEFNSDYTWLIPAGATSIEISAYGEDGGDNGGSGRSVSGTLSATPGNDLRIDIARGGGNGGDAGVVFYNGTARDDIVIAGAGGGGDATGDSDDYLDLGHGGSDNSSGGNASVDESEHPQVSASGGGGGNRSSVNGSGGSYDSANGDYTDGDAWVRGGGGGAGYQAGSGGGAEADVYNFLSLSASAVAAAGGGGGGGKPTARGVSSSSYSGGLSNNSAHVVIDFTSSISWNSPGLVIEKYGNDNILSWNSASHPHGTYDVYRDGAKIGSVSGTSYTDTDLSAGLYQYQVYATNPYTSTGGNTASIEQHGVPGTVRDSGTTNEVVEAYIRDNGSLNEVVESKIRIDGVLKDLF